MVCHAAAGPFFCRLCFLSCAHFCLTWDRLLKQTPTHYFSSGKVVPGKKRKKREGRGSRGKRPCRKQLPPWLRSLDEMYELSGMFVIFKLKTCLWESLCCVTITRWREINTYLLSGEMLKHARVSSLENYSNIRTFNIENLLLHVKVAV